MIQICSEVNSYAYDGDEYTQNSDSITDFKWKYEIIRNIGAPWNWIYQFFDHGQPNLRSYNFYECQHKFVTTKNDKSGENLNFSSLNVPGIGLPIPDETTMSFLNFVKVKARENNGLISPKCFSENDCPKMY